jgi:hypothetical protein
MDDIGEQHRHLFVLGVTVSYGDRRAACVTESGTVPQFGATRMAGNRHRVILAP